MILSDLRDYLKQRGSASLQELSWHFDVAPDVLRGMLAYWIRKGQVQQQSAAGSCEGCTHCDPATLEFYRWGASSPVQAVPLIRDLGCHNSGK